MINQADKNGNCNLLVATKTPVVSTPPQTNWAAAASQGKTDISVRRCEQQASVGSS